MGLPRLHIHPLVNVPGLRCPRAALARAWRALQPRSAAVAQLWITSDAHVRELNRTYRHQDRVTDVLTFPYHRGKTLVAGDIFFAAKRMVTQARERQLTVSQEFLRLAIHGLVHLAGHDHHTREEFMAMRAMEMEQLLNAI